MSTILGIYLISIPIAICIIKIFLLQMGKDNEKASIEAIVFGSLWPFVIILVLISIALEKIKECAAWIWVKSIDIVKKIG